MRCYIDIQTRCHMGTVGYSIGALHLVSSGMQFLDHVGSSVRVAFSSYRDLQHDILLGSFETFMRCARFLQFKVKGSSFLGLSTVVVLVFRVMFAGLWFEA